MSSNSRVKFYCPFWTSVGALKNRNTLDPNKSYYRIDATRTRSDEEAQRAYNELLNHLEVLNSWVFRDFIGKPLEFSYKSTNIHDHYIICTSEKLTDHEFDMFYDYFKKL